MNPSEERLLRYVDGELSPEEVREMEALLEKDGSARAVLRDLEAISDVVRDVAEARGKGADTIADWVMQHIETVSDTATSSVVERRAVLELPRRSRLHPTPLVSALGVVLAAAATAFLYFRAEEPSVTVSQRDSSPLSARAEASSVPQVEVAAASDEGEGAAIEAVDFGSQNGTIFMVATGPDVTPVVWLSDDVDEDPSRMKHL